MFWNDENLYKCNTVSLWKSYRQGKMIPQTLHLWYTDKKKGQRILGILGLLLLWCYLGVMAAFCFGFHFVKELGNGVQARLLILWI